MALVGALEKMESVGGLRSRATRVSTRAMRSGAVAAGAALASFLTVKLAKDPQQGYAIAGKVPLTLTIAGLAYLAAGFNLAGDYDALVAALGDGALASYAGGVGRLAGQGQYSLVGLGAKPPLTEAQYANLVSMTDRHRRHHHR
jgi:hypothetical protein